MDRSDRRRMRILKCPQSRDLQQQACSQQYLRLTTRASAPPDVFPNSWWAVPASEAPYRTKHKLTEFRAILTRVRRGNRSIIVTGGYDPIATRAAGRERPGDERSGIGSIARERDARPLSGASDRIARAL